LARLHRPERRFRAATPEEAAAMRALADILRERAAAFDALPPGPAREAAMQDAVYDAGRRPPFLSEGKDGKPGVGRAWFQALYEVLLGKSEGRASAAPWPSWAWRRQPA
jgi:lysyl-tRNA synthetase class 1